MCCCVSSSTYFFEKIQFFAEKYLEIRKILWYFNYINDKEERKTGLCGNYSLLTVQNLSTML